MADKIDKELESLDSLDFDIEIDLDEGRDPSKITVDNINKILQKELVSTERLKKVGERLIENIPKEIESKLAIVKRPLDAVKEEVDKQLDPLRDNAATLLEGLEKNIDNKVVKNVISTIKKFIKRDKLETKEESVEEKVKRILKSELSEIKSTDTISGISELVNTYQNYSEKKLLTNILATIKATSETQETLFKEYNKTHLKIEIKQLIALESMNKLLTTNVPLMIKYMESIVKNTSLPDIAKLKTGEYFKHMFANKLIEGGIDFISKNSYVENVKNAIKDKVSNVLGNLGNALGMGSMLVDTMAMSKEMGISPLETIISTIADAATNKAVDTIGKKAIETALLTGIGRKGISDLDKYTSDIHYGASDLAEKLRQKGTVYGDLLSNVMEFISEATSVNKVNNIKLKQHQPNEPAIFDYQTKTAIVNVIPTYLAKIYAELVGIRTGKRPESELVYDYYKNKFVTTTELRREVQKTILKQTKELSQNLDDKRLFGLLESRVKLTPQERKQLKEAYIKHIMSGGTTSPYYLERDGFYKLLPESLANKVKTGFSQALSSTSLRDIELRKDMLEALEELRTTANTAGVSLSQITGKVSELGRTDVLEELGLLDSNDHTEIKSDKIADLFGKAAKKYTTGKVTLDTHGLSYQEYIKAVNAKKSIIEKINNLKDTRISQEDKEKVIKLLEDLPYNKLVDIDRRLKSDVNIYLFIKDMLERHEKINRETKSFKDKIKEKIDQYTPEQIKKLEKDYKEKITKKILGIKENIKTKLDVEDKIDKDKIYEGIWEKENLEGTINNKVFNPEFIGLKHKHIRQYTQYKDYTGMRAASIALPNTEFKFIKDVITAIKNNTKNITESIKIGVAKLIESCCNKPNINDINTILATNAIQSETINKTSETKTKKEDNITEVIEKATNKSDNKKSTSSKKSKSKLNSFINNIKSKMEKRIEEENEDDSKPYLNPHMRKASLNIFGPRKDNNKNDTSNEEPVNKIVNNISSIFNSAYSYIKKEHEELMEDIFLEQQVQRLKNGGKTNLEVTVDSFKSKLSSKFKEMFSGINKSSIEQEYRKAKTKYGNKYNNVKRTIEEEYNLIKKEGLIKTLSRLLSRFPLPEPDNAEVFYKEQVSKIDPLGIFTKIFKNASDFVSTMYVIHFKSLEGASIDVKELEDLGINIDDSTLPHSIRQVLWGEADQSYYNPTNTIERFIPRPLRDVAKSYGITDLASNLLGRFTRMGIAIPKALLSNISVIKDTAKESFFDDSGRLRINLLRLGKFLGKSYIRTAVNTGKQLRGAYSDFFGGIGDIASYGSELLGKYGLGLGRLNKGFIGSIASKIPGLNKLDEKILVRRAPLPYEVKAAYLRGTIKFKDIPLALGPEQRDVYLKWLMDEAKSMPKKSPLYRLIIGTIKTYTKSAFKAGETLKPIYKTVGKFGVKAGTELSKFTFKALGSEDIRDMLFKTTKQFANTAEEAGEILNPIYKDIFSKIKKTPSILSKILGIDEVIDKVRSKESKDTKKDKKKSESNVDKVLDKLKSIIPSKKKTKFDRDNDGIRDGSYEERLKEFEKENKDTEKDVNKITKEISKDKSNSFLWTAILGGVTLLVSKIKSIFGKGFMHGLGTIFESVIWKPIKWLGKEIWKGLTHLGSNLLNWAKGILSHIPGFSTVSKIVSKTKNIISDVTTGIKDVINKPSGFFSNAFNWIKEKASSGLDLIKRGASFIKEKITDGVVYLTKHAKAYISKLTPEGIKRLVSKLKPSMIKEAISKLVNKLSKKIGYSSAKKIGSKLLARLLPGVGIVLAGIDTATIAYYTFVRGWSLPRAIAYTFLGIDIEDDNDEDIQKLKTSNINNEINLSETISKAPKTDFLKYTRPTITKDQEAKIDNELKSVLSKFTNPNVSPQQTNGTIAKFNLDNINVSLAKLVNELKQDEGVKLSVYRDKFGNRTIGVGHLLELSKGGIPLRNIIGVDKNTITPEEADYILLYDIARISKQLYNRLPWLKDQPENIRRNLINMAFNLGVNGLLSFTTTLKLIKEGRYKEAAINLTKTRWYNQVGNRARRIVNDIFHTTGSVIGNKANKIKDRQNLALKATEKTGMLLSPPAKEEIETKLNTIKNKKPKIDTELANIHTSNTLATHQIVTNKINTETNEILKESLKVQMTMAHYLKGIYDLTKLIYTNGIPTRIDATEEERRDISKQIEQTDKFIESGRKHIIDDVSKPVFSVSIERF